MITALEAQRAAIDEAIVALRRLAGAAAATPPPVASTGTAGKKAPTGGPYRGLKIGEATKRLLNTAGRPLSTRDIAQALVAGGMRHKSTNWTNTVYASLARRLQLHDPYLVRLGSKDGSVMWGLRAWSPHVRERARSKAPNGREMGTTHVTGVTETPRDAPEPSGSGKDV